MFNLFNNNPLEEYQTPAKDINKVSKSTFNPQNEYFRVGATTDGMTTLTIMSSDGFSSTLSLNRQACEQLIRMLRATFVSGNQEQEKED